MSNAIKYCAICGISSNEKRVSFVKKQQMYLCMRHESQIRKQGHFFTRTQWDKNEYIIHDNYAEIVIYNKECQIVAYAKIDIDDIEKCKLFKWSIHKDKNKGKTPYVIAYDKKTKKTIKLHRYLLNYEGQMDIDHINKNGLDNRKSNLRIVSHMENIWNKDAKNVFKKGDKWESFFRRNGTMYYIGRFNTEDEAIEESNKAKKLYTNNIKLFLSTYNGYSV